MNTFDAITVDMNTGKLSYPSPEGFVLDMEKVYSSAAIMAPYCQTVEQAIKHAIHEQISAYKGMCGLFAQERRATR